MKANTLNQLLAWHRRLGLLFGLFMLLWALTGILHPIMSATQPQPAKRMPPPQQLDFSKALPIPRVLAQHHIKSVSQIQALQFNASHMVYRIQQPQQHIAQYYDSQTGAIIPYAEQQDAQHLAQWYVGLHATHVRSSTLVTQFDDDYPRVNRLLPVWRIDFDNGTRAYVEPSQRRLATLSNDAKMWMARIFRLGHTWSVGQGSWWGQQVLMKVVLIGLLAMSVLGLMLFIYIHNRQNYRLSNKPSQRFHRYLGVSLWGFIVLWLASGLFHQWHQAAKIQLPAAVFLSKNLSLTAWQQATIQPLQQLNLVASDWQNGNAKAAWLLRYPTDQAQQGSMIASQVANGEHQHHHNAQPSAPKMTLLDANTAMHITPEQQAQQLTAYVLKQPLSQIKAAQWITSFSGEYGFINKRLPVLKVQTQGNDGLRLYIEPSTGLVASNVSNTDALEGLSFAYLHKWRFIDINKTYLDVLMGITASLIVVVLSLGYRVYWLRRNRRA